MKQYTIKTPVTYRIRFENIRTLWYHKTVYHSLKRALNSYFYYLKKYRGERVVRIYAYRGDLQLRDITKEMYNLLDI